ncbi:alpha-amylase family protein [Amycolatopsis granulosa]|uniref:alpha-amylase family protein n=1 Tax=Amycolatopsis granulosa TaxID=185684 RepID=UPI001421EBA0|nr:alpha-amylase family protein [Amycolatopsis granulosa]NIH83137.1 glycosidase [Amycolatopsis granulosa]
MAHPADHATWADHVIWWHVYPLGFTGAPPRALPAGSPPEHRLGRLAGWLDYAVELGCSGLLLGPVFASETHGYDTTDHFRIDPRLGDDADFDRLVAAARDRGMRIVLDGVFNHVARGFGHPQWWRRDGDDYAVFEGHRHLVALDHTQPAVADHVGRVMSHWLGRGVDGWRLDAAYAVPAGFWARVLPGVRRQYPGAWFLGEVLHGDYAGYVTRSGLDSVTQYELWKAIWSSLHDGNFFELAWALNRHDELLGSFVPQTFAGNHDVTRLASTLPDERHLAHALAVLFTVGGVPSVYYGDEQAFRGIKEDRAGGDDEIRPEFPADPAQLAPYGWPVYRLHQRLIGLRRRNAWLVRARTSVEHLTNRELALRSRSGDDEILTLLNTGDEPRRFPVRIDGLRVLDSSSPGGREPWPTVPAHGWAIFGR